ncbi:MAG: hypothetical protein ACJ754_04100 [Pyrinomonadaceae bacterium]
MNRERALELLTEAARAALDAGRRRPPGPVVRLAEWKGGRP